jgi:type I restriction enzyme S subunit
MSVERQMITLSDVGRIVTGKTPPTADKCNYGGDIPFVTPSDMDGRKRIATTERYLTPKGLQCVKSSALPMGTVMVSCIGSDMGKAVIAGTDCVSNQQINSIIVNQDVCAEYVYYELSRRKEELQRLACSGSAQPILNKGHFSQLPIILPPLSEQKAIADILGSLDDKIELNRKMNETLEEMARAIFKSWFVDFDPVHAKAKGRQPEGMDAETARLFPSSFEDSEIGRVPKGWKVKRLGELIELAYGKALKAEDRQLGTIPVFGSNGQVGWHNQRLACGPGIVVGRKGNPGIVKWVPTDFFPIDTTFYVVTKEDSTSLRFLFFALVNQNLSLLGADSAVPGLNRNQAYMSLQLIPPPGILRTFDESVTGIFDRIHASALESATLIAFRDALLPRLLSGEITVPASRVA